MPLGIYNTSYSLDSRFALELTGKENDYPKCTLTMTHKEAHLRADRYWEEGYKVTIWAIGRHHNTIVDKRIRLEKLIDN